MDFAESIAHAFASHKTGVFEAGTGTGKSLAALIPAALSGKKVVVSTATISLQEQYIHKDIPTLQSVLPFEIEAALMKGRGNYVGLRRYSEHILQEEIDPRLVQWIESTESGDISEFGFAPPLDQWLEINSDSDDCLRNKCKQFNDCFYFQARRWAEQADILVVNHALLLADAASEGNILPPYELLIVDEAHQLPEIACKAFSVSISSRGLQVLAARALKNVQAPAHLVHNMEELGAEFFQRLNRACPYGKTRMKKTIDGAQDLMLSLHQLSEWLSLQEFDSVLDVENARDRLKLKAKALISTAKRYIQCLDLLGHQNGDWVLWTEKSEALGGRIELVAAPLKISGFLDDLIFSRPGLLSSIWMSATLATAGDDPFAFFKQQVGAPRGVIQLQVASPFDYARQALLYLPSHLPEPNHPDFIVAASQEIEQLLCVSDGRAFVLFTSYAAMNNAYDLLANRLPYECKRQGDMSRQKLIEWFQNTPCAVLFGTSSFWEGVSIDGDQLSCVVIDRIPFQVPDDPVYEARCEALKGDPDASWFNDLALPHAIMRLKQGVGRLIRTRSDRGIVAILDPRVTGKQYGRAILACLPPMTIIKSLRSVESVDQVLDSL